MVEMREGCLLLRVQRHFSLLENASSNQGVLRENELGGAPRKRSLWNTRDRSSAKEIEVINFSGLEVASPSKKKAETERSTTLSKIITRNAKILLNANSQERSENIVAKRPETTKVAKKKT